MLPEGFCVNDHRRLRQLANNQAHQISRDKEFGGIRSGQRIFITTPFCFLGVESISTYLHLLYLRLIQQ